MFISKQVKIIESKKHFCTPSARVKGCMMKKTYLSKNHAQNHADNSSYYLRPYHCQFCRKWHLTSKLPRHSGLILDFSGYNKLFDQLQEIYK